ncbi:MarP family serine protease [Mobilicoccus massiliensis]|uniref:MarP family serine protease n=1 Tax=Mobilicoccus massiliensis TaxID=1522310 RepID=UPI000694A29E|nr:MarP family serine protease [Mobilicoccus massiliensis]
MTMTDAGVSVLALDVFLAAVLLAYVAAGLTRGFVQIAGAVVGFALGGLLGLRFAPDLVARLPDRLDGPLLLAALAAVVVFAALVGQAILSGLARRLPRRGAVIGPIDRLLGGVVSLVLAAATVWLGAGALRVALPGDVSRTIDGSRVLRAIDDVAPVDRNEALHQVTALFARYEFPRVFEHGGAEPALPAEAVDPAVADHTAVARAGRSVVRIDVTAPACGRMQEGSGFVVAPGLIVTNAHVVSGAEHVSITKDRLRSTARVVAFDAGRDLAVLSAETGDLSPIPLASSPLRRGADAAVAGYPLGGPYTVSAARVGALITARGRDIYDDASVSRQIYGLRADIHPGNSGGPLLTTTGEVAGVVFARSQDEADTAYALRLEEVAPVLATARAGHQVPVGGCTAA